MLQGFYLQLFSTAYYYYGENFLAPRSPIQSSEPQKATTWSWEQEPLNAKKFNWKCIRLVRAPIRKKMSRCPPKETRLVIFRFPLQLLNILNSLRGTWVSKRLFQIKDAGVWKWPPNCLNWALIL